MSNRTETGKDVFDSNKSKDKLNNLLSFVEHSEKYSKLAKKTKRTDVAKDILEKKKSREPRR